MFLKHYPNFNYDPKRIISLVPSQTELLSNMGLEEETIAITKFCIHPSRWHSTKIKIGGTKNIHTDEIILLKPDLILCNKEENMQDQITVLAEKFPTYMTDVNSYEQALGMIKAIGVITGKKDVSNQLVDEISSTFQKNTQIEQRNTKTVYLIWKDPFMTVGGDTFISSMMEKAGFNNVFKDFKRYPTVTLADIQAYNPANIFLSTEPYPFKEKHKPEFERFFPNSKVFLVDGEMFSWYGNRMLYAAKYFKELHRLISPY
jgi:ABC-type Fe3+-hydroxamate transport system substrate-binding protein